MNEKRNKLLYHITALDNLKSIFEFGLLSRSDVLSHNLLQKNVADETIIKKRKELRIIQYIPFHFFEKTAFTGAVYNSHPKTTFCVIAIRRSLAELNNFLICTAHPLSENPVARILPYKTGFDAIDWVSLEKRDYSDERSKNAGMAECLATSPISPLSFQSIAVPNEKIKEWVLSLAMSKFGYCPFFIDIKPEITQAGQI